MTKTTLIIAFMIAAIFTQAQTDSARIVSLFDTALIQQYSSSKYKINHRTLNRKELRDLLMTYPESKAAYLHYRKNRNICNWIWIAAGAGYIGSIFAAPHNPELAIGMLGGSVALMLATIPSDVKADRSIHHAVWVYNRAVLMAQSKT